MAALLGDPAGPGHPPGKAMHLPVLAAYREGGRLAAGQGTGQAGQQYIQLGRMGQ